MVNKQSLGEELVHWYVNNNVTLSSFRNLLDAPMQLLIHSAFYHES